MYVNFPRRLESFQTPFALAPRRLDSEYLAPEESTLDGHCWEEKDVLWVWAIDRRFPTVEDEEVEE